MSSLRQVIVFNQFALPRSQPGGTRHVDLFAKLDRWDYRIFAGDRNYSNQAKFASDETKLDLVAVPASDGSPISRVWTWTVYSAKVFWRATQIRQVDVVYGSSPHLFAAAAAWAVARVKRAGFVLEIRDLWPESFVSAGLLKRDSGAHRLLCALEKFVCRRADAIVAVTTGWERHFAELGVDISKVTVVPNGSEVFSSSLPEMDPGKLRSRGYSLLGVFAGTHGPKDGIDLILDAARENPSVGFVLVGDGSVKSDAIRRSDKESLRNVCFLDPVGKDDLAALLRSCDFGIHAVSGLEIFRLGMSPNKVFDYMAAGLPVVSNAGDGLKRMFEGRDIGILVGSDELPAGVRALTNYGKNRLEKSGENAARLLDSEYSRSASARKLESVLNSVVDGRSST